MEVKGKKVRLNIWVQVFYIAALWPVALRFLMCPQDTAGAERFRALASSHYRGAQGVILGMFTPPAWMQQYVSSLLIVIQCTTFQTGKPSRPSPDGAANLTLTPPNPSSRSSLATRLTRSVVHHLHPPPFLTPAQESSRQVSTSEGEIFARRMDSLFIETSAMTAVGVRETFEELVEKMLDTPELWVRDSTGGNGTGGNDDSVPGNVNIDSDGPQPRRGCAC